LVDTLDEGEKVVLWGHSVREGPLDGPPF
jgi:hypothetical protein